MDGERPALAALGAIDDATAREAIAAAAPAIEAEVRRMAAALKDRALQAADLRAVSHVAVLEALLTHRPGRGSLSFWTRRVIHWRLVEVVSRERPELVLEVAPPVLNGENPEEVLQALELRDWMESAVGELPPRRRVIIAAAVRGETLQETGATLGIGRSRVCQERKTALTVLRDRALEDGLADE